MVKNCDTVSINDNIVCTKMAISFNENHSPYLVCLYRYSCGRLWVNLKLRSVNDRRMRSAPDANVVYSIDMISDHRRYRLPNTVFRTGNRNIFHW